MNIQPELLLGPIRIGILLALLLGFGMSGGFTVPDGLGMRMQRYWIAEIGFYLAGSLCVTCLDVKVGLMDRTSQRILCILGGLLLMGAGLLGQYVARAALP